MKFTLGFSPCPNDTFIFDALVNKKIDTGDVAFDVMLEDVQTLNQWALQGKLHFSKISYGVLPLVLANYTVLNSGGALGNGVGPLLIAKTNLPLFNIPNIQVAIPGENTTAHLLFSYAFPFAEKKVFKPFNEIENAVLQKEVHAGVIIHESRFTYREKGLIKLLDLGEYWQQYMHMPIPLGGIVAKKNIDKKIVQTVSQLIQKSIAYSFENNHTEISAYVKKHASEMNETVMRQHIDLYVNDFSLDLQTRGRQAILQLLDIYAQMRPDIFINKNEIFAD